MKHTCTHTPKETHGSVRLRSFLDKDFKRFQISKLKIIFLILDYLTLIYDSLLSGRMTLRRFNLLFFLLSLNQLFCLYVRNFVYLSEGKRLIL